MPDLTALKQRAQAAVDALDADLQALSLDIHAHPEENFEERYAHDALTDFLEARGFEVERGAHGLATAFRAVYGDGEPTLALLCEYDALPIGHACGHNLIAIAGAGAGLAVRSALEAPPEAHEREAGGAEGTLLVLGTPAEEGGGGKLRMIEAGAFDGVDAALMVHPSVVDRVRPSVLAIQPLEVEFRGRAAHAAAQPWEGRNALDALVHAYNGIALLRQQLRPEIRVHGVVQHGGDKPNIIPDRAAAEFYVRAPTEPLLDETLERVQACFRAAAEATGCEFSERRLDSRYSDLATNDALARAYAANAAELGLEIPDAEQASDGEIGSTDMGNVSHLVPGIHPLFAIPAAGATHTIDFREAAARPEAHAATLRSTKALAMTALDLLADPDLRGSAKADFDAAHA